jgi:hypothetical protein
MFEKYLKYKTKYLNLKGGNIDLKRLNKLESFFDKIFFHAIAFYNIKNKNKLIITGRKIHEIYNNTKRKSILSNEELYLLYTERDERDIENIKEDLIRLLTLLILERKSKIIHIYNQLLHKLNIKTDILFENLFIIKENNIYCMISSTICYKFCDIIYKDLSTIKRISYPLRQISEHYSRKIEVYDILLDITNFNIEDCNNDIIKSLIESKPFETNKLLLTNDDSLCNPEVYYTVSDNNLHEFNHNYQIYKHRINDYSGFNYLCDHKINKRTLMPLFITKDLKKFIKDEYPDINVNTFLIYILFKYIDKSWEINNKLLSLLNTDEKIDENISFKYIKELNTDEKTDEKISYAIIELNIYFYVFIFINMMAILNIPIMSQLKKFNVYSVSQSLYNFNSDDNDLQFIKGQIYTFPIFKSTTLAIKYNSHPLFIGNDLIPTVFEIEIDPVKLSGSEFMFANTDQYEVILSPNSDVRILDVDRCYTKFSSKTEENIILRQACTHIKCELLRSNFYSEFIPKLLPLESVGGDPNKLNSLVENVDIPNIVDKLDTSVKNVDEPDKNIPIPLTEINLTKYKEMYNEFILKFNNDIKEKVSNNPFILDNIYPEYSTNKEP